MIDELVIKVPAPFSGVDDLGFSARYPAQERNERLRDVPLFIEGPAEPMRRLVDRLALFAEKDRLIPGGGDDEAYTWTPPVRLADEVCILAFRDRSLHDRANDAAATRSYVWNLVRPLGFTFLRDCVRIGQLRLADRIAFVVEAGSHSIVDLEFERSSITPHNGELVLTRF
jgi:hypothetical protein